MALIKCRYCGSEISDKAEKCPKCGAAIIKEKKNKSKIVVSMGIAAAFIAGVIVGGYSHSIFFDSKEKEETAVVAEKEPETIDINEEKEEEDLSEDDRIVESDVDQNENEDIKEIKMHEPMDITHAYGEYTLTVDAVRRCDWLKREASSAYNRSEKVAILVEMDMKNKSFESPYNDGIVFLDEQMEMLDENNYCIPSWGMGYDDGEYHMNPHIPVGTNGKVVVSYIVDKTCKKVTITFNNQYKIVADVTD